MKLIIAEKAIQAATYANVIGNMIRKNGYFEGNGYQITWCIGHLFGLANDKHYHKQEKWSMDYLPLLVDTFHYELSSDVNRQKQYEVIEKLAKEATTIINGTDADREGELIFRTVLNKTGVKKPVSRLWLNSLEDNDIRQGLHELKAYEDRKDEKIHISLNKLSTASELRQQFDWLVGVNGTQAMTVLKGQGKLLTIGRVQTVVLKIIVERYLANKSHKVSFRYRLVAQHKEQGVEFKTQSIIFDTEAEAQQKLAQIEKEFTVLDFKEKKQLEHPPLLFSLNTLIIEANKQFKYSSKQVLETAQTLYEKKMITYPRTDCEYINEEKFEKMKGYIPTICQSILEQTCHLNYQPKAVDNSKLDSSHDAIVPTGESSEFEQLSELEKNLFRLIVLRTVQSFGFANEYKVRELKLDNHGLEFIGRSKELTQIGFSEYQNHFAHRFIASKAVSAQKGKADDLDTDSEDNDISSISLPVLSMDSKIAGTTNLAKLESKPKPLYTGATLTTALMKIGQHLIQEGYDLKEIEQKIPIKEVELGTDNTRVNIIERLIKLAYIEFKHNKYYPTELGLKYYELIKDLEVCQVMTTVNNEVNLRLVEKGELTETEFRDNMRQYIKNIVQDITEQKTEVNFNEKKKIATCPKCKEGEIFKGEKSFYCSRYKENCKFGIFRQIAGKNLTDNWIQELIQKKKSPLIKGFAKKVEPEQEAKKFDAHLILNEHFEVKFEFPPFKPNNTWKK